MARILIIDDNDEFRGMLCKMLKRAGYEVESASDGEEGVKSYREKPADLVIADIVMPNKDGIRTIKELEDDFPDMKVIAISGGKRIQPSGYLGIAEMLSSVKHTFAKPLPREEFLQTVKELIEE